MRDRDSFYLFISVIIVFTYLFHLFMFKCSFFSRCVKLKDILNFMHCIITNDEDLFHLCDYLYLALCASHWHIYSTIFCF